MQAAEKMVLDMFFRDGVGKDRKNSYVVAEKAERKASQTNDAHGAVDSKAEQVEKELAETSSIKLKQPFSNYSEDKQKTIEDFVEYRDERMEKYVDAILSGNQKANNKLYLDTISDRAADDIQNITGIDTHGFDIVLFRNIVEHIEKRHGKNGTQDQSMKHIEDWERIQYVLNSYDTMQFAGSTSAFTITKKNGQQKSAPTVIYSKAINGTFYVVEAVPDTKNKTVNIVTAYTQQKGQNGSRDVQSPTVTSETTPVIDALPTVNNIPKNDVGNVGENVNNLQNKAASAAVKTDAVPEVTGKTDGKAETEVESKEKTVTEPKAKTEVKTEIKAEENPEETPKVDTEAKVQAKQEGKAEVPVNRLFGRI